MISARRALLTLLVVAVALSATAQEKERPQGWYAEVTTSFGSFTFRLLPEQAPQTVAHFVAFATGTMEFVDPFTGAKKKEPYYDNVAIHKAKYAVRFEAGDRTGTGHGMPPVWVPSEPGPINFTRPYRVGMTGATLKRISGVLFFVSIVSEPYLNASHNCFGEVIDGRDVIERICNVKTDQRGMPLEPVYIRHVAIVKSGNPDPLPEAVPYDPPVPQFGLTPAAEQPTKP
jgi:peptidyl-prolyl cis-trans isomerase A (cyclophilin A)